ncbi:hypothetical protein [Microvirga vignae]|uniref:hypothetical protein n=1 Tax=Microvirga vignae TaxID=1225564 RepID=UPI00063FDD0D|nr:hypothetical protein [Microvirga vignae]
MTKGDALAAYLKEFAGNQILDFTKEASGRVEQPTAQIIPFRRSARDSVGEQSTCLADTASRQAARDRSRQPD